MRIKIIFLPVLLFLLYGFTNAQNCTKEDVYTPEKGSKERKEILDALRKNVFDMHHINAIFVVNYMKVYDGWAWIHTMPQEADGTNRYEDMLALVHKKNGEWKILEIPCTEEENPNCITSENYYEGLKKRFPELPECILPGN
jgi:hypothetical protein